VLLAIHLGKNTGLRIVTAFQNNKISTTLSDRFAAYLCCVLAMCLTLLAERRFQPVAGRLFGLLEDGGWLMADGWKEDDDGSSWQAGTDEYVSSWFNQQPHRQRR